jgi:predicted lipid-binding transport protein (Tim44 family)
MTAPLSLTYKKPTASLVKRIGRAAVVALIVAGTFSALDAEAKRMGGGRSVGRQSQTVQQQQSTSPAQQPMQQQSAQRAAPAQPTPAAAAPSRSRWLGPIAGLAAGLGIAALLSHFGLGEAFAGAMANFIVIALIAMVAIWLIRKFMSRRRQNEPAYGVAGSASMNAGGLGSGYSQEPRYTPPAPAGAFGSSAAGFNGFNAAPDANAAPSVPAGFDTEAFLRNAKVSFVRLQAAWDEGNIADIREFATPEMFAEVKIDIDARGTERNQTDVVQLDAQLLEVEDRGSEYFASVRFSGLIRETAGAAAEPFVEVWNLSKSTRAGEGWLLAGIQQVSTH